MEETRKNGMLVDVDEFPKSKGQAVILAIQHVLAMFVACITVPLIVFSGYTTSSGANLAQLLIAPTIVSAGIGTLFYLFMTKFKSPMFLATSFAYLSPMITAVGVGFADTDKPNLWLLPIGMLMVGIVYVVIAIIIKFCGVKWLNKLLPPLVIGPVIMVIGLGLAGSAINNLTNTAGSPANYNLLHILSGLVAMFVTAICAHYGKKTISLIPFVIGMAAGYVFALALTGIGYAANVDYMKVVDLSPIVNNFQNADGTFRGFQAFLDYPKFLFLLGEESQPLTGAGVAQAAMLFIPVSLVTICEHIGDHENMSGVIQKNLLEEPGLDRTLIGDGVATALSGGLCGAANTTYGENVAVVGVSKVASTKVIAMACGIAILLGFISPLMSIVQTIPGCICGGVSLVLYGFIASSGVKILMANKIDMGATKSIFVASTILVAGIGGLAINFAIGEVGFSISSTAVAMILGIIMNLILRDKKEDKPAAPTAAE
ncbi:MAG: uracil-xanthine permease [Bacilli bacterium]|nr:uracil-xanthine permease [Bacilli bacterium]